MARRLPRPTTCWTGWRAGSLEKRSRSRRCAEERFARFRSSSAKDPDVRARHFSSAPGQRESPEWWCEPPDAELAELNVPRGDAPDAAAATRRPVFASGWGPGNTRDPDLALPVVRA